MGLFCVCVFIPVLLFCTLGPTAGILTSPLICRLITQGGSNPLISSFKLSYYTLLNLVRRTESTGRDIGYVIAHSFTQFQHERRIPEMEARLRQVLEEEASIKFAGNADMTEALRLQHILEKSKECVLKKMLEPQFCLHFLRPGRIVRVAQGEAKHPEA
jgi:ATP-dependent RNA helicase DOB1